MIFDLPPPDPAVELVLATHGMSKGIGQTDGPQFIAKSSMRFRDVQLGVQWKNVSAQSANGEGALFANASKKLGSVQLNAGIALKFSTGISGPTDSTALELTAGASRKFGPVTLRLNTIYSPDDLGSARRSLFVEGGPAIQLGKGWTASAAIGRRHRAGGADYSAFNAGVSSSLKALQLDLRYYDTDRSGLGDPYRSRIVGSVKIVF